MLAKVSMVVSCWYPSLWCVSLWVMINIIRKFKTPFELEVENRLRKSILQYIYMKHEILFRYLFFVNWKRLSVHFIFKFLPRIWMKWNLSIVISLPINEVLYSHNPRLYKCRVLDNGRCHLYQPISRHRTRTSMDYC